ncbi:hypothetical protein P678_3578 [Acinetobacter baumannii UH7807]|uniref:Uncharacterized protein n=2 Tax=Acinetobacter baumannii TaxID=470 RepID=A0ABC9V895_ACIBA|nr:Hypothetical protein ABK1_1455 [Acinetobacter baumannii 1656-2]AGQ10870.1 hypothetical protein BJAB0868_02321 [Acinetobacter baumannii BJAB0868]AGQ14807.1 hypothetical protein BJAB07104_02439 [Acinetobacter baumannii BJAB07104]ATU23616.1 hypothetical protein AYP_002343 [Acinetobacter baumannii]EJG20257.1 hypothetical protein ACIN5189_A1200 [Acinetobacter baumannii OIFC189]EJG29389.1 hypothetical protein ACINNAV7_A0302 [Acinetobacter baumannii Naval-17]EKA74014.1 hypothetical protein ACINIS
MEKYLSQVTASLCTYIKKDFDSLRMLHMKKFKAFQIY